MDGGGREKNFNTIPVFAYNKVIFWELPGSRLCKTTTHFSGKYTAGLKAGIFRTRSKLLTTRPDI
jgi:nucleoside recognition membrane protein YjiH